MIMRILRSAQFELLFAVVHRSVVYIRKETFKMELRILGDKIWGYGIYSRWWNIYEITQKTHFGVKPRRLMYNMWLM
jgi:hypothetical protein